MKPPLTLIDARVLGCIALGQDPWERCKRFHHLSNRASQIITNASDRLKKKGFWYFPDGSGPLTRTITPAGQQALGEMFRWVTGTPQGNKAYRDAVLDGKIFARRP